MSTSTKLNSANIERHNQALLDIRTKIADHERKLIAELKSIRSKLRDIDDSCVRAQHLLKTVQPCCNAAKTDPKTDGQDNRIKNLLALLERDEEDTFEKQIEQILNVDDEKARKWLAGVSRGAGGGCRVTG